MTDKCHKITPRFRFVGSKISNGLLIEPIRTKIPRIIQGTFP
jgi:hypothetical protein